MASRLKRPLALQHVQHRIDHALADDDGFAGRVLDRLNEFIALHLPPLEQLQDKQFRDAVEEVRVRVALQVEPHTLGHKVYTLIR